MFKNYISLGSACPLSSSMSKYGLRSWSGPFDWLITNNFKWVLHYIENEFEDFLLKENLEVYGDNPKQFKEINSGFIFIHDKNTPFIEDYDKLKEKYQRRTSKFMFEITNPTCFFRAITNQEEVKFITQNALYISDLIKRKNINNDIIFLGIKGIDLTDIPFKSYTMHNPWSGKSRKLLRGWFDDEIEFLEYCASQYSATSLMNNIIFDNKNELKNSYISEQLQEKTQVKLIQDKYDMLVKLLNFDFSHTKLNSNIIIYGAGNIGINFYRKIKNLATVKAFIDQNSSQKNIDGISVIRLKDVIIPKNTDIIVTATYDYENIYNNIKNIDPSANIISLLKLIEVTT